MKYAKIIYQFLVLAFLYSIFIEVSDIKSPIWVHIVVGSATYLLVLISNTKLTE